MTTADDVIAFWTRAGPAKWFAKSDAFDEEIRQKFQADHFAAARGQYAGWTDTPRGVLGLLLLLDQFPRNLFRDTAHAMATDCLARAIARDAIDKGWDQEVEPSLRIFLYLPLEHSEAIEDQDQAVALIEQLGDADQLKWARIHRDIIARFGRFPHRNAAFGRRTTAQEQRFVDSGGFNG